MTDETPKTKSDSPIPPAPAPEVDDVDVHDAMARALPPPAKVPSLVSEIQSRIHQETGGAYYRDSFARSEAPIRTYLVTAVLMLGVLVALAASLMPCSVTTSASSGQERR